MLCRFEIMRVARIFLVTAGLFAAATELLVEALRNPKYSGTYNATAPKPVRMSELCSALGKRSLTTSRLKQMDTFFNSSTATSNARHFAFCFACVGLFLPFGWWEPTCLSGRVRSCDLSVGNLCIFSMFGPLVCPRFIHMISDVALSGF